jgi:hypothetical protein
MIINKQGDYVQIIISEGKTMLKDGEIIPALNWTICIPISDKEALLEYLTENQINQLQGN